MLFIHPDPDSLEEIREVFIELVPRYEIYISGRAGDDASIGYYPLSLSSRIREATSSSLIWENSLESFFALSSSANITRSLTSRVCLSLKGPGLIPFLPDTLSHTSESWSKPLQGLLFNLAHVLVCCWPIYPGLICFPCMLIIISDMNEFA